MHLFSQGKQRDQINPRMFIWSSLYPLASISPRSWHQLMCVALKSNLYHLNESKAPRRYSRSPISTHQLLPLYSLIIWAGLRWLVGLLMWCRLLVFPLPTGRSPDFSKTLVEKAITHWQLCYCLPKQWGEAAIFKFTLGVVFAEINSHRRDVLHHPHSCTRSHPSPCLMLMCHSSGLWGACVKQMQNIIPYKQHAIGLAFKISAGWLLYSLL